MAEQSLGERLRVALGIGRADPVFVDYVYRTNADVSYRVGALMAAIQLLLIADALFGRADSRPGLVGAYAVMFVVSTLLSVAAWRFRKWGYQHTYHQQIRAFEMAFVIACTLYGMHVSGLLIAAGDQAMTFILVMTVGACMFVMPPVGAVVLTVVSYVAFSLIVIRPFGGMPRAAQFTYWLSWLTITMVSVLRYQECRSGAAVEAELKRVSGRDELTGLKNRRALRDDFPGLADGTSTCVVMCDVDDFKRVNDEWGHTAGDDVLEVFADSLAVAFGGDACYRYGGDEFVCFVRRPADEVVNGLDAVRGRLRGLTLHGCAGKVDATMSAGVVAGSPVSTEQLRGMMRLADERLYAAKEAGKDCARVAEV